MADNFSFNAGSDSLANPYASPAAIQTTRTSAPIPHRGQQNIWRDGKRVVVMGPHFSFPAVCIKTGRLDDLQPQEQTLKHVSHGVAWMLMFGAIGLLIARSLFGQQIQLTLPVSSAWLANKKKHGRIGLFIALTGGALFVLGIGGMMMCSPQQQDLANLLGIPAMLGMLVGLIGLIYMAIAGSVNLLTVNKMDGNLTWLDGASPEFLSQLPEWGLTGPIGAPGVMRRS